MESEVGQVLVKYSANGIASYTLELSHRGLHKHRLLRAPDLSIVKAKALLQAAEWNELWTKRVAAEQKDAKAYETKEARRLNLEHQKEVAADRTVRAQAMQQELRDVLVSSLAESKIINF